MECMDGLTLCLHWTRRASVRLSRLICAARIPTGRWKWTVQYYHFVLCRWKAHQTLSAFIWVINLSLLLFLKSLCMPCFFFLYYPSQKDVTAHKQRYGFVPRWRVFLRPCLKMIVRGPSQDLGPTPTIALHTGPFGFFSSKSLNCTVGLDPHKQPELCAGNGSSCLLNTSAEVPDQEKSREMPQKTWE